MPETIYKHQVKAELDRFYGNGKWKGDPVNPCYQDGYYAVSLERKYGMPLEEIVKTINYDKVIDPVIEEMRNTLIPIITKKLFPFMGIYGLVMQRRRAGEFFIFEQRSFEAQFRTVARQLVEDKTRGHKADSTRFLILDWMDLRIPYTTNPANSNPELEEALRQLDSEFSRMGYIMDRSDNSGFTIRFEE